MRWHRDYRAEGLPVTWHSVVFILAIMVPSTESRQDLEFRFAVEQFVMSVAPETRIPEPYHGMIEGLWSDKQKDRDAASRRLTLAIGKNDRWLFWARRFPRAEIAYRANRILRAVHPCRACNRVGQCVDFVQKDAAVEPNYSENCKQCGRSRWAHEEHGGQACEACNGTGSSWVRGVFE